MSPAIINLKPSKTYIPANSLCYEKKKQHTLHTLTHSPNRKTSTFAATTHFMPTSPKDIFNIPIRYKVYIYIYIYFFFFYIPCIAISQILVPCTFLFFSILRGMRAMILPFIPHRFLISPSFPLLCSSLSSQVRHPCISETVGHLKTRLRRQIPGQMIQSFPSNPKFPNCSG